MHKYIYKLAITTMLLVSSCKSHEEQLSDMLNWKFLADMAPTYKESAQANDFKAELQKVVEKEGFRFCYFVNVPNYFILHVLPYFHVLPAPLCGVSGHSPFRNFETPESMMKLLEKRGYSPQIFQIFSSYKVLKKYSELSKRNVVVSAVTPLYDSDPQTVWDLSHGVDEDQVYARNQTLSKTPVKDATSSLLFTQFVETNLSASVEELKKFYQLDPNKRTIFYTGTYGPWEFLEVGVTPEATWKKTYEGLLELKKDYNIIYRPHPQIGADTLDLLKRDFIIAESSRFPSFAPFYDVADIVVGSIGSTITAAASRSHLPIVLLRPTKSWPWGLAGASFNNDIYPVEETAKKNKGLVLDEETAIVQNEHNVDLVAAVKEAFATNTPERIANRKKYFNYWFGCIDGYEEYREMINYLESQGADVESLKKLYRNFPVYRGRPLCL